MSYSSGLKWRGISGIFLLAVTLFIYSISANAVERPSVETVPVGFAAVGGSYLIPNCDGSNATRVTSSSALSSALGSNKIIILAPGNYSGVNINGQTNLTIVGEDGANLSYISISGSGTKNILIRNVSVIGYTNDGVSITGGNHLWLDHCSVGWTTTSNDMEFPDGAIDIKSNCTNITISWCNFFNSWKTGLLGSSNSDLYNRKVTMYCNYYYNTYQRTPRIRAGETHVLNCMFENSGWCRPESATSDEFTWQEEHGWKDDGEFALDHRMQYLGYSVMAAKDANALVENCFFWDVRLPIVASRSHSAFHDVYGEMQSPDISNATPIALKQIGNEYDDSGLLTTIKVKDASVSSSSTTTSIVPLGYEFESGKYIINPDRLNPGGRSIMFDELNPESAFSPSSYTDYYPSGFSLMTAQEVRNIVPQYAGANRYQFCAVGDAPSLSSSTNRTQSNIFTIDPITFTWGGGAIDAKIFDLPKGLVVTRNISSKTLVISGTPEEDGTYTVMTEGGGGDAVLLEGTISLATSSIELLNEFEKELCMYPNPASEVLFIKNIKDGASVEIYSSTGEKVKSSMIESGKVTVANLRSGIYLIRVYSTCNILNGKLMISK